MTGGFPPLVNLKALAPVLTELIIAILFLPIWIFNLLSLKSIARIFIATALLFFVLQMLELGEIRPVYQYADDPTDVRFAVWTMVRLLLIL